MMGIRGFAEWVPAINRWVKKTSRTTDLSQGAFFNLQHEGGRLWAALKATPNLHRNINTYPIKRLCIIHAQPNMFGT